MLTPLRQAQDRLAEYLIGLAQLAFLALQRLKAISQIGGHVSALATVQLGLIHPLQQRLRDTAYLI